MDFSSTLSTQKLASTPASVSENDVPSGTFSAHRLTVTDTTPAVVGGQVKLVEGATNELARVIRIVNGTQIIVEQLVNSYTVAAVVTFLGKTNPSDAAGTTLAKNSSGVALHGSLNSAENFHNILAVDIKTVTEAIVNVPIRQVILDYQRDAVTNEPNYIAETSGTGSSITVNGSTNNPLRVSIAAGYGAIGSQDYVAAISSNTNVTGVVKGLRSSLYVERAANGSYSLGITHKIPSYKQAFNRQDHFLLHCNGTNNSTAITDEFGNTWAAVGDAKISTAQSKWGGASLLLDGTGDYVQCLNTFNPPSEEWEYECWFRASAYSSIMTLFSYGALGGYGIRLQTSASAKIQLQLSSTGSSNDLANSLVGATTITADTWHHARLNYRDNIFRLFLNNSLEVYTIVTTANTRVYGAPNLTGIMRIGATTDSSAAQFWNGYIDEARWTNGFCRNVIGTVPSGAHTEDVFWFDTTEMQMKDGGPTSGWTKKNLICLAELDASNHNTLIHADGANNSTTITETFGNIVVVGGDAKLSTSQFKFGTASITFDGNNDYVDVVDPLITYVPVSGAAVWDIDFWIYPTVGGVLRSLCNFGTTGSNIYGAMISLDANNKLAFYLSGDGSSWSIASGTAGSSTIALNTWTHITAAWDGTNYKGYVNGTSDLTVASAVPLKRMGGIVRFGNTGTLDYDYTGFMDEIRVRVGYIDHTANFTAPVAAYSDTNYKAVYRVDPYYNKTKRVIKYTNSLGYNDANVSALVYAFYHGMGTKEVTVKNLHEIKQPVLGWNPGQVIDFETAGYSTASSGIVRTVDTTTRGTVSLGGSIMTLPPKTGGAVNYAGSQLGGAVVVERNF